MKKIFIFILLLLVTGCSVDYDLTITDKEKIKENFKIYVDNNKILETSNSIEEYLDYYSNLYLQNDGYEDYIVKTKKSKPYSYFIVTNSYDSLDDYITSVSFKSMFNDATIERVGNYISFRTSKNAYLESIKNDEIVDQDSKYESFKIRIKFYNEVTTSNAIEVDKKHNIYTWEVSENSETDYIYFKIGPKVKYNIVIMDYIQSNIVVISIIGISTLLLLIAGLYIYWKSKKNNEV